VFFDSFGVGFQAEVLRLRNEDRKTVGHIPIVRDVYRDQAVYAGALLSSWVKSFQRPEKMRVEIVADGRQVVFDSLLDIVVKNTAIYGGAWLFARDSAPDDGLFEVVPFAGRRELFSKVIADLSALPDLREDLEALGVEHTKTFKAKELDIRLAREGRARVATQIDGEEWVDGERFKISVRPRAIDVLTPAGWLPPWRPPATS
jgi:diacylglycerol kinase family enzyme